MRRRFFVDGFEPGSAFLRGEAAHHLGRVLRAQPGQLYELSDGRDLWLAKTEQVRTDEIRFSLVEQLVVPIARFRLALLLSIVKYDRFEWALEKAVELGVDEFAPLAADRSEKGLVVTAPKRAERWKRILAESAQQARRLRVPTLCPIARARDSFSASAADVRILLSERDGAKPLRDFLEPAAASPPTNKIPCIALGIGPEGGWTEEEFTAAQASGFAEAALSGNILRTETAVCAALASVQYAFGAARHSQLQESRILKSG